MKILLEDRGTEGGAFEPTSSLPDIIIAFRQKVHRSGYLLFPAGAVGSSCARGVPRELTDVNRQMSEARPGDRA